MGRAARRARRAQQYSVPHVPPAPFVARPFHGLAGEADWVAMREILPTATAQVRLRGHEAPVSVATLLPNSWAGWRRDNGELVVALQSGCVTGDPSRDVAAVILELLDTKPGHPVTGSKQADANTPRLQDLLVVEDPFTVQVHERFDFWESGSGLSQEPWRPQREAADEAIIPTAPMSSVLPGASAYWCRIGDRAHIRLVLTQDENDATDALARLHASQGDDLGEGTRLLGAFRACGLLIPVWDLDPKAQAADYEDALARFSDQFAQALSQPGPLDEAARRAKAGLLSRQLTLR